MVRIIVPYENRKKARLLRSTIIYILCSVFVIQCNIKMYLELLATDRMTSCWLLVTFSLPNLYKEKVILVYLLISLSSLLKRVINSLFHVPPVARVVQAIYKMPLAKLSCIKPWSLLADPVNSVRWTVSFYLQHVKWGSHKKAGFCCRLYKISWCCLQNQLEWKIYCFFF